MDSFFRNKDVQDTVLLDFIICTLLGADLTRLFVIWQRSVNGYPGALQCRSKRQWHNQYFQNKDLSNSSVFTVLVIELLLRH